MIEFCLMLTLYFLFGFFFAVIANDIQRANSLERLGIIILWPLIIIALAAVILITDKY